MSKDLGKAEHKTDLKLMLYLAANGTKYSRMDQVKFVEDSL